MWNQNIMFENWNKYLQQIINESKTIDSILNMSVHDFDQTKEGWRRFNNPSDQVKIIKKYINKNPEAKSDQVLMWHLGQALAMSKDTQEAIKIMESVVSKEKIDFNKIYYTLTIMFLKKDMNSFNSLYKKYSEPIKNYVNQGITNAIIVNCMKSCGNTGNFNYKSAYTVQCPCGDK